MLTVNFYPISIVLQMQSFLSIRHWEESRKKKKYEMNTLFFEQFYEMVFMKWSNGQCSDMSITECISKNLIEAVDHLPVLLSFLNQWIFSFFMVFGAHLVFAVVGVVAFFSSSNLIEFNSFVFICLLFLFCCLFFHRHYLSRDIDRKVPDLHTFNTILVKQKKRKNEDETDGRFCLS